MYRRLLAILLVVLSGAPHARANDSVAAHAIGGLELVESAEIEMAEEDLFISLDEVKLRYVFVNRSDKAITATVAFPIPDIEFNEFSTHPFLHLRDEDITKFTIEVDGKRVPTQREIRVFHRDEEITDGLIKAGRSLIPFHDGQDDLFAAPFTAPWTVRIKYHWRQVFPPNAPVVVEHRYLPVVGNFPFEFGDRTRRFYCAQDTDASLLHEIIWSVFAGPHYAQHVHYVLGTANNWKGPIGRFKLTIQLGHRFALL